MLHFMPIQTCSSGFAKSSRGILSLRRKDQRVSLSKASVALCIRPWLGENRKGQGIKTQNHIECLIYFLHLFDGLTLFAGVRRTH